MDNKTVTMAHGAGGRQTSELIDEVFKAHFANPDLTADDAAVLGPPAGKMAVSTDGFIVSPAFFPGGNIGKLSICGTVNDLACMGAKPMYLTCAFVIEEGFPMEKLEEIAAAMEKTAKEAGVRIVSGDTKVAGKGQVDGVFITTTGMGEIQDGVKVGGELAKPGDAIIVTGDVGRHGCTILLAREDFGIDADVTSDCAPLWGTVKEVMDATHNLHVIRDATRGGVGTVLYEIAGQSNVGIRLDASSVPVAPEVKGVCGMLGLEPLYLACEGRMVIMAPKEEAEKIVAKDREHSQRDLFESIEKGDFPKWKMCVQIMPEKDAETYRFNPFDLTKVWSHKDYPLIEVGVIELNRNPENYFADVEQSAFNPANVVPGISFSPDKMLQGRLFSYGDAQRYRLGVNHHLIPVNKSRCPFHSYHRDGQMRVDGNYGSYTNYEPNSNGAWKDQPDFSEPPLKLSGDADHWKYPCDDADYYEQPGKLFRVMTPEQQEALFGNTARAMAGVPREIQIRHIYNCSKADPAYGKGVADALGIPMSEVKL